MVLRLKEKIKKLPDKPGIYFFTRGRDVLYIGKATSLRDRVRSYFTGKNLADQRGERIVRMLDQVTDVRTKSTDSVLEALLLESALIKKYQPKYNSRDKDDKSYWQILITQEIYPRVLMVRGRAWQMSDDSNFSKAEAFGPFPSGVELREALRLIRKIFPFRDKCQPLSGRPCFSYQLGFCPGVCVNSISKIEYRRQIGYLKTLLSGKVKTLIKSLEKEMRHAAKHYDFELSAKRRDQIKALQRIQDIALIKKSDPFIKSERFEAYDIAHLSGTVAVGVMVVAMAGDFQKQEYRKFKVNHRADDLANLKEILNRRLAHSEWFLPQLIIIDGGKNQLAVAQEVLKGNNLKIPLVAVVKDEHHRPRLLLGNSKMINKYRTLILKLNHEAHRFAISFHRSRLRSTVRRSVEL